MNTSETIRSGRSEDGRILLDVRDGQMFSINFVGSQILDLLQQGWDEARIAGEIARAYEVGIEVARADVREFIDALCKYRIVQAPPSAESRNRR